MTGDGDTPLGTPAVIRPQEEAQVGNPVVIKSPSVLSLGRLGRKKGPLVLRIVWACPMGQVCVRRGGGRQDYDRKQQQELGPHGPRYDRPAPPRDRDWDHLPDRERDHPSDTRHQDSRPGARRGTTPQKPMPEPPQQREAAKVRHCT